MRYNESATNTTPMARYRMSWAVLNSAFKEYSKTDTMRTIRMTLPKDDFRLSILCTLSHDGLDARFCSVGSTLLMNSS